MIFEWLSHIKVEWLSFVALVVYAYLTYLIAKDIYNPLVSFYLEQREQSHINFIMVNKSKVEVKVFGIVYCKIENELFEHEGGFYGNKKHWILQPFTKGFGHFYLDNMKNKEGVNIKNFLEKSKISSINFNMEIRYIKTKGLWKKWIKTSPQTYLYNFENGDFWLDV